MKSTVFAQLWDMSHTAARPLLEAYEYPWEALQHLETFIRERGRTLPPDEYTQLSPEVWVARDAQIAPSALLCAPSIIGHRCEVRPGAYLRGSVLAGDDCVIGNSTELKNCVLFDQVQVPHFNYVGDSILGYRAHMGAGALTSNVKGDRSEVVLILPQGRFPTGRSKFGALLGDGAEIGCHSVLNPGTLIGAFARVYPLTCVRGYVAPRHICKAPGVCVPIRQQQPHR